MFCLSWLSCTLHDRSHLMVSYTATWGKQQSLLYLLAGRLSLGYQHRSRSRGLSQAWIQTSDQSADSSNPSCLPLECVVTAFLVCELKVCHWSRVKETSGAADTLQALSHWQWMSFIARHRRPIVTSLIFVRTERTFCVCTNSEHQSKIWICLLALVWSFRHCSICPPRHDDGTPQHSQVCSTFIVSSV